MTLRWRQFEKDLAERLKPYDARRRMSLWHRVDHFLNSSPGVPLSFFRGLASLVFVAVALANADSIRTHPDIAAAGLGLWGLAVAVFRVAVVLNPAGFDSAYGTLWMLPVAAGRIYERLLRRLVAGSLWLLCEFLLVYGMMAAGSRQPLSGWMAAAVCASLQAAFSLVVAFLLAMWKVPPGWVLGPFFLLGMALPFCFTSRFGLWIADVLYRYNPMGWLNEIWVKAWMRGDAHAWWFIVPLAAVSASLPFSLKAIKRLRYQGALRVRRPPGRSLFPQVDQGTHTELESPEERRRRFLSERGLRPMAWDKLGWVKRFIGRALDDREKTVAEVFLISEAYWGRQFLGLLVYLALYLIANTLISFESLEDFVQAILKPGHEAMTGLTGLIASFVLFAMVIGKVMSLFCGMQWPERMEREATKAWRPYRAFRLFPVSYWETTMVIAKTNTVIFGLLLPLAVLLSLTSAYQLVFRTVPRGALLLPKCLTLFWGLSLLFCSMNLTPSLEEGLRHWKPRLRLVFATLVLFSVGMGLMASPTLKLDLALGGLFVVGIVGWLRYCGRRYRDGR